MKNKLSIVYAIPVAAVAIGIISARYYAKALKKILSQKSMEGRYRAYYQLAFDWLVKKNEEKSVMERWNKYFNGKGIKTIAIYGSGTLGELLYNDIKNLDLKVCYFIDKNAEDIYGAFDDIPVVKLKDIKKQEKVDAVIVTPIFDFNEIEENLSEAKCISNIISLADIIYSL